MRLTAHLSFPRLWMGSARAKIWYRHRKRRLVSTILNEERLGGGGGGYNNLVDPPEFVLKTRPLYNEYESLAADGKGRGFQTSPPPKLAMCHIGWQKQISDSNFRNKTNLDEINNMYNSVSNLGIKRTSKFPFLHNSVLSPNVPGLNTHIYPYWTDDRLLGPTFLYNFDTAFKLAKRKYGSNFAENFPEPYTRQSRRLIHSSSSLQEGDSTGRPPSSKVEQTVKVLEKELEKTKQGTVETVKRPLYKRIQDEILHYYHGFRLLVIDTKISANLIWRILNGKNLTRREYKQLIRTTSDLFRLVPFSVFIIVPFMELLLPFFIKLFPGMLPSTFQSSKDRESKMKTELKVKLEMAKFLQQTLDEMAPQATGRSSQGAKEFADFIQKIRTSGSEVTTDEILKFSKLFEDEITLDSLTRPQLLALCRVLEIPALGTTTMLRFQLRMRLRNLVADDQVIEGEGVDALDLTELQNACKARGMRAVGVPEDRLKRQLRQWLTLSLHEKVPASLLLLTRAMYLPENLPATQQLQATLQSLPDSTTLSTKAAIGEREGKVDNKTRLELIQEEERRIREERKEARMEAKIKEEKEAARREMEGDIIPPPDLLADPEPTTGDIGMADDQKASFYKPEFDTETVVGVVNRVLYRKLPEIAAIDDQITSDDFDAIEDVVEKLGKDTKLIIEREEIKDLKAEISDYIEDVNELQAIAQRAGEMKIKVKESKGARRLFNKLNTMVHKLDEAVTTVDANESRARLIQNSLVATEELMGAVRKLRDVKDPAKLERIASVLAKLDDDKDGKIEVDDLVKVIDVVGKEHIDLSSKQLEEIVTMLAKEEMVEEIGKERRSAEPSENKPSA